jgi:hypothetical protein
MLTKTFGLGVASTIVLSATLPEAAYAEDSESFQVPAELWDRPRSGRVVIAVPAVRHALKSLLDNPGTKLAVRHPPDLEPTLQAEELRAWLVAHALEPARIVLRADLQSRQLLQLEISR